MKLNTPVQVGWLDAVHIPTGWQTIEFYRQRAREHANIVHKTVGILIDETENYVVVALSVKEGETQHLVNLAQVIHKDMIVYMEEVKKVKIELDE